MNIETLAIIFAAISIGAFSKGVMGIGLPMSSIPMPGRFTVSGGSWCVTLHRLLSRSCC